MHLGGRINRREPTVRSPIEERLIRLSASDCLRRSVDRAGAPFNPATEEAGPQREISVEKRAARGRIDLLYLFACHALWEQKAEPSAAWEVLVAARSDDQDTRAHALSLLANSRQMTTMRKINTVPEPAGPAVRPGAPSIMKTPYGLEIVDSCLACPLRRAGFVCDFPAEVMKSLDLYAQHNVLPAGAQLFVEGQEPRGVYFICSGRVKLTTASREGKTLLLRMAEAGTAVGLSAAIAGSKYQMTAETATPCQVTFIESRALQNIMRKHPEAGIRMAQVLGESFQSAYREIHDLVLTRSSEGKLVRLLLSAAPESNRTAPEVRLQAPMTHEEMAQRIGSSRETVTRLLSSLKRKQFLRQEGSTLVIQNRRAFESLAV